VALGNDAVGETFVEVGVDLKKLLAGFKEAEAATKRWDQSMAQNAGRSTERLKGKTEDLSRSFSLLSKGFREAGTSANRYTHDVQKAAEQTVLAQRSVQSATDGIKRTLIASATTIAAAFGAREIVQLADSYANYQNRLRIVATDTQNLANITDELYGIANRTRNSFGGTAEIFSRLAVSANELGVSQSELLKFTESLNQAIILSGANAQEAQAGLIQLSQGMASGTLRGDELRSVLEQLPAVADVIAKQLGVTRGELRKMGEDGEITAAKIIEAFAGAREELAGKFATTVPTVGQAMEVLNNQLGRYIGETSQAFSATERVAQAIQSVGNNLDTIMPILTMVVTAIGVKYTAALGAAAIASIRKTTTDAAAAVAANVLAASTVRTSAAMSSQVIPTQAAAGALGTYTLSATAATAAMGRMQVAMIGIRAVAGSVGNALLAAFGGPVGLAITALIGITYAYHRAIEQAKQQVADFNEFQKVAAERFAETAKWGREASNSIQSVGTKASGAANYQREFAGATGEAARALQDQAKRAQEAAIALQELNRQEAQKNISAAQASISERTARTATGAGVFGLGAVDKLIRYGTSTQDEDRRDAQIIQKAQETLQQAEAEIARLKKLSLETFAPAFQKTQGRDIGAEITQLQQQLVAANKSGNQAAQREILKQIKLREAISKNLKDGLSFEVAVATAEAQALGSAKKASATAEFTAQMADEALQEIGATVTSGKRSTAKQAELFAKYKAGKGPLAAAPGTSLHEADQARDIAKTPGMSLSKIRDAIEGAGGKIKELLDEGTHFHVAWAKSARDQAKIAEDTLRDQERYESDLAQINDDILQAQSAQITDPAAIADLEKERITVARDRYAKEIENRVGLGQINEMQAAELMLANERLRTQQLANVDEQESARIRQERLDIAGTLIEGERELLGMALDLTTNEKERRALQLRILDAEKRLEDIRLDQIIYAKESSDAEKDAARIQKEINDLKFGAKTQDVLSEPYVQFADDFANALGRAAESVLALENPLAILQGLLTDLTSMFNEEFILKPFREWASQNIGMPVAQTVLGGGPEALDAASTKTALTLQIMEAAARNAAQALTMISASGATGGGGGLLGSILGVASNFVPSAGLSADAAATIAANPGIFHDGGEIGRGGIPLRRKRPGEVDIRAKVGEYVMPEGPSRRFGPALDMMRAGQMPSFGGGSANTSNKSISLSYGDIIVSGVSNERAARRTGKQIAAEVNANIARSARNGISRND